MTITSVHARHIAPEALDFASVPFLSTSAPRLSSCVRIPYNPHAFNVTDALSADEIILIDHFVAQDILDLGYTASVGQSYEFLIDDLNHPLTFKTAISGPDHLAWQIAQNTELTRLIETKDDNMDGRRAHSTRPRGQWWRHH